MPNSTSPPPFCSAGGSRANQSRWSFSSSEDGGALDGLQSRLRRSLDHTERIWGRMVQGVDPYWEEYRRRRDSFAAFVVTLYHTHEPTANAAAAAAPRPCPRPRLRRRHHHDNLRREYMEGELGYRLVEN